MYNGPERRITLDKEIVDLKVLVASFTAKVEEWMKTTVEYRRAQCAKNDIIIKRLDDLPCEVGNAKYDILAGRVKVMTWTFVTLIAVLVFDMVKFHMIK